MVSSASQAPLDRLQEGLPGPLKAIPLPAMLAAVGLAAIGTAVLGMVAVRGDRVVAALEAEGPRSPSPGGAAAPPGTGSARAAPEPPRRSAVELETARAGGVEALAALARRFPDDAEVLKALSLAQARERKDLAGALKTLRHLLEVAPEAARDREVQQALVDLANGPADVAAEALEVLKTRMGSAGPDLVFELVQGASGKYAKEHAAAALDDPALMKSASRALLVADELRRWKQPCARKASVAKAAAEGDGRSLHYLRPLAAKGQCGGLVGLLRGPECSAYACISPTDRATITAAIAAIEKRDPAAAKAPAPPGSASAAPAPSQGGSMLR